jgi:hypothetical protein
MLLSDEEIQERVSSPLNLLNRLRHATTAIPSLPPPKSDDIIPNISDKIDEQLTGDVRKQAAEILSLSLKELKLRIPDVQKPEKLAQIASEMNKVLVARDDKESGNRTPQVIVYAPQVLQETHFESITLSEDNR